MFATPSFFLWVSLLSGRLLCNKAAFVHGLTLEEGIDLAHLTGIWFGSPLRKCAHWISGVAAAESPGERGEVCLNLGSKKQLGLLLLLYHPPFCPVVILSELLDSLAIKSHGC